MKAVKITKILWNLNGLGPKEKEEVKNSLPTSKGFMADDDFEVVDKVPAILQKKYGYEIINFSYSEIHIVETIDELLKIFAPKGEKPKKLFNGKGELSEFGEGCFSRLLSAIHKRIELEKAGTQDDEMPKVLDKLMLSLEKITGLEWDKTSEEEYKKEINVLLQERISEYLAAHETKKKLRKDAKKSLKGEIEKLDSEDEEDYDYELPKNDDDDDDDDDEEE